MIPLTRPIRKVYQFFTDYPIGTGIIIANRYKVSHLLGRGSFGIAYECVDLKKNRRLAIKQLRPSKRKNSNDLNLFYNEASILSKLDHKAIPNLLDQFEFEGNLFYVMDFIEGENLEDILFEKRYQFGEKESLQLLRELVEIVDYLHYQEVYHGDLRIPNVIIRDNQPVLIDFGLAINVNSTNRFCQSNQKQKIDKRELRQHDYFDLGDLLLFLLYSSYPSKSKKALPWTEELSLQPSTTHLLRRLLGIGELYSDANQILNDIDGIFTD